MAASSSPSTRPTSLRSSFPLSTPLERALLLSTLAESLQTFVADSEPAEAFYRLARHAMDALFAGAPSELVAAYFDVWVLRLSGLFPNPAECAACGRPLQPSDPLLLDESRPGFIGPECRRGEVRGSRRRPARRCSRSCRRPSIRTGAARALRRDRRGRAPRAAALSRTRAEVAEGADGRAGMRGPATRLHL